MENNLNVVGIIRTLDDLGRIVMVRTFISPKSNVKMSIDNYRMFDGKTPEDYAKAVDKPSASADSSAASGTGEIDVNTTKTPAYKQVKSDAVAEVKDADLSKLIIYDEIQSPLVQLYLYDGKNWVEQKLAEEIPNPKKYIDEDGRLFIQFRAVGNASEYMEVTTPVLMLEGRAK